MRADSASACCFAAPEGYLSGWTAPWSWRNSRRRSPMEISKGEDGGGPDGRVFGKIV